MPMGPPKVANQAESSWLYLIEQLSQQLQWQVPEQLHRQQAQGCFWRLWLPCWSLQQRWQQRQLQPWLLQQLPWPA